MITINYIHHDGFVVNTSSCTLVFDYWRGERDSRRNGQPEANRDNSPCLPGNVQLESPIYIIISHSHKDHFDPAVFEWASRYEKVHYIVSRDVMQRIRHVLSRTSVYNGPKVDPGQVTCLRHGETFDDGTVKITAFPSTDIGNSYTVEAGGRTFFHAGDLNAWIWKDESTEQEVRKALGDFKACLRDIKKAGYEAFDFAFFPVDSRIGTDYFTGARVFVREFRVARFFPMHFSLGDLTERLQRRTDALRFESYMNPDYGEYISLTTPGDRFVCSSDDPVC